MKKVFYSTVLSLLLTTGSALAFCCSPSKSGDVVGKSMSSSAGKWLAKFGQVGIYNSSTKKVLEASNTYPVIRSSAVNTFTNNRSYWGARRGIGSTKQHYKTVSKGSNQKNYSPKYTFTPYFKEGRWVQASIPVYNMNGPKKWVKKWVKKRAKFRCDSFVQYCYKKGVGKRLVKKRWQTSPKKVFKALPHYSQSIKD